MPAEFDQFVHALTSEFGNGLISELILELRVRQRTPDIPKRLFDKTTNRVTICEFNLDMRLILGDRCVADSANQFAHVLDLRIIRGLVGVLLQPSLPSDQPYRR